jgi:hypothetical protein
MKLGFPPAIWEYEMYLIEGIGTKINLEYMKFLLFGPQKQMTQLLLKVSSYFKQSLI